MAPPPAKKSDTFWTLFVFAQFLIAASILCCIVWVNGYLGGFGWETPSHQFNWHPLCTIIGFVGCYSEAIMLFRVASGWKKFTTKLVHAVIQIIGVIIASFGIFCVYAFHIRSNINNLYSLHSWVGQVTAACFTIQVVVSFWTFLFPRASGDFRKNYLPVHIHWGLAMYAMVIISILTGITEKVLFATGCSAAEYPAVDIMGNTMGILVIATGLVVAWISTCPEYKRNRLPEETPLAEKGGGGDENLE